jgi:hypothetical protein
MVLTSSQRRLTAVSQLTRPAGGMLTVCTQRRSGDSFRLVNIDETPHSAITDNAANVNGDGGATWRHRRRYSSRPCACRLAVGISIHAQIACDGASLRRGPWALSESLHSTIYRAHACGGTTHRHSPHPPFIIVRLVRSRVSGADASRKSFIDGKFRSRTNIWRRHVVRFSTRCRVSWAQFIYTSRWLGFDSLPNAAIQFEFGYLQNEAKSNAKPTALLGRFNSWHI